MSYLLFGLADWRDIMILAVGSITVLVLLAILVAVVVIGLALRVLIRRATKLLNEDVSPLLGSAQETVHTVRGTASFVSETAVRPIIRVYGVLAGAKRAASVITGIGRNDSSE